MTPPLQAAGRRVAYHTFSHVLDLDLAFHLERRTGTLTRILERGNVFSTFSSLSVAMPHVRGSGDMI